VRTLPLGIFILVGLATPAAAEWKTYAFPELGVAKDFPARPERQSGTYQTVVVGDVPAPATMFSVEEDWIRYKLTVVELSTPEWLAKGASLLGECVFLAEAEGRALENLPEHVPDGTVYGVHGRGISVDLEKEMARKETTCFYTKGRLYKSEAVVLPERAEPDAPEAFQFTESIRFDVAPP
jgi:hypothetical protein